MRHRILERAASLSWGCTTRRGLADGEALPSEHAMVRVHRKVIEVEPEPRPRACVMPCNEANSRAVIGCFTFVKHRQQSYVYHHHHHQVVRPYRRRNPEYYSVMLSVSFKGRQDMSFRQFQNSEVRLLLVINKLTNTRIHESWRPILACCFRRREAESSEKEIQITSVTVLGVCLFLDCYRCRKTNPSAVPHQSGWKLSQKMALKRREVNALMFFLTRAFIMYASEMNSIVD